MKFIKILFSVLISSSLYSQTIIGNKVEAKSQLRVAGYNITGITNDTNLSSGSIMKLPTEYAVKNFANNQVSKDTILGTSKTKAPSQYAVKKYVDENSGGGGNPTGLNRIQYNKNGVLSPTGIIWDSLNNALSLITRGSNLDRDKLQIKGDGNALVFSRRDTVSNTNTSSTNFSLIFPEGNNSGALYFNTYSSPDNDNFGYAEFAISPEEGSRIWHYINTYYDNTYRESSVYIRPTSPLELITTQYIYLKGQDIGNDGCRVMIEDNKVADSIMTDQSVLRIKNSADWVQPYPIPFLEFKDNTSNETLSKIGRYGQFQPPTGFVENEMDNNSLYYDNTEEALFYKDPNGVGHNLQAGGGAVEDSIKYIEGYFTQSGTNPLSVTIMKNTTSESFVSCTRSSAGYYNINFTGNPFPGSCASKKSSIWFGNVPFGSAFYGTLTVEGTVLITHVWHSTYEAADPGNSCATWFYIKIYPQ